MKVQLAAVCRLLDHYGWSDVILNHASARDPQNPAHFWMNPYGLSYSEVTASQLVKVDFEGNAHSGSVNQAGVVLHSAIYEARSDVHSIIHTHTPYGVAVSSLACGLLCEDQMSMLFHDSVGYHDFEGIAVDGDEKKRFAQDLGKNKILILRNHGLVATGASIAEAFWNYYYLEFACRVQILAMSARTEIYQISEKIKKNTFEQHEYFCKQHAPTVSRDLPGNYEMMFAAQMRMLDRKDKSYRD